MAVMQVAHGGNERDTVACLTPATNFTTQHRQCFNDQHCKSPDLLETVFSGWIRARLNVGNRVANRQRFLMRAVYWIEIKVETTL
jgi:hypothetical protein